MNLVTTTTCPAFRKLADKGEIKQLKKNVLIIGAGGVAKVVTVMNAPLDGWPGTEARTQASMTTACALACAARPIRERPRAKRLRC